MTELDQIREESSPVQTPPTDEVANQQPEANEVRETTDTQVVGTDTELPQEQNSTRYNFSRAVSFLASPLLDETGSLCPVFFGLLNLLLIGTLIGLVMPKNEALPTPSYRYVSNSIGYVYFLCWSVSFYPQVISNYKRKSTEGLSPDFSGLNVLGFACYSAYSIAFFFSPTIQRLYRERYGPDAEITVQSNDVAFAIHALILSSITFLQIGLYDGFRAQQPSKLILLFMVVVGLICVMYPIMIVAFPIAFNWLDYFYLLSFVKIAISLIKYIPQVILNYQRKSTVGWSIWNIILDFSGGTLSDLQLVLDCADLKDFSGITGNLAKLGLGSISIIFDVIFFVQHYVLYAESTNDARPEAEPLLANNNDEEEPDVMRV